MKNTRQTLTLNHLQQIIMEETSERMLEYCFFDEDDRAFALPLCAEYFNGKLSYLASTRYEVKASFKAILANPHGYSVDYRVVKFEIEQLINNI